MIDMNEHRGTGRTTRMIEHARRLAIEDRRAVYIVAANQHERERIRALVGTPDHGIKVETPDSLGPFDWQDLYLPGAHPRCVVLVDHFAIEAHYGQLIDMLHAYDGDGWFPIESAPEGPVQLFSPSPKQDEIGTIWISGGRRPHGEGWRGDFGKAKPTRWRPLPPPPRDAKPGATLSSVQTQP